jgi:hypothetical protein
VIAIVQADADDLGRAGDGRAQFDVRHVRQFARGRTLHPARHAIQRFRPSGDDGGDTLEAGAPQANRLAAEHHARLDTFTCLKCDESQEVSP